MHQPGPADVLLYSEVETPLIHAPQQCLIRIQAAGVNPLDTKLRSRGTYYPEQMPAILGCDGAGVIEAIGEGVSRFQVGDEVWFCHGGIGGEQGCYAEYKLVDEDLLARKPANLGIAAAGAAPLVLITAWEALHDRARIQPGQKVFIHGGAGGVGHIAIQLAKAAGCEVATTVSSVAKAEQVRRLGADCIINYQEDDVTLALREWSSDGADVVLDTVGGKIFEQSFALARPYAQVVTLLQPDNNCNWKEARIRNLGIHLELMLSPMYFGWREAWQHQRWILEQCGDLVQQGKLQIRVDRELPLQQAAQAHQLIEAGKVTGKLVLRCE